MLEKVKELINTDPVKKGKTYSQKKLDQKARRAAREA